MPSIYLFEADATSSSSLIEVVDREGSRFKIQFPPVGAGIIINKTEDGDPKRNGAISIIPHVSNEIKLM